MKAVWIISLCTLLIAITVCGYKHTNSSANLNQIALGLREFVFEDSSRIFEGSARKLEVAIWYPTHQTGPRESLKAGFWKTQPVVRNAPMTDGTFPLILFSHGYGGSQWSNSWFAEQLVPHGYIVASVRHYGNSARNMIPELCVRAWNRPHDISFVLDYFLQDPELSQHIDQQNIGAAGFSQGGLTALWLAGIQADLTPTNLHQQITALSDPEWRNEHFADLPAERLDAILNQFTTNDFEAANRSYQDPRIKAVFAMAPALDARNIIFDNDGLKKANIPTHIIVGQADTECIPQALFFARHIPQSIVTILPGHVGHLTMLNEGIEPGNTVYTTDHQTINRAEIHAVIAEQAINFFDRHLKNICSNLSDSPQNKYPTTITTKEIKETWENRKTNCEYPYFAGNAHVSDLNEKIEKFMSDFTQGFLESKPDPEDEDIDQTYYISAGYDVTHVSDHYISCILYTFRSDEHFLGLSFWKTFNYDLVHRKFINLQDLYHNVPDLLHKICEVAKKEFPEKDWEYLISFFDMDKDLEHIKCFTFTHDTLTLYANMGGRAVNEVTINHKDITDAINI